MQMLRGLSAKNIDFIATFGRHQKVGGYPVKPGLIIGHEPVGIIHELGEGITGYEVGDRVLVGAIAPCGQCNFCLGGNWSQCGGPLGGWKFGNTINVAQAEYLLVPHAQANLAKIPEELADEQVVLPPRVSRPLRVPIFE